MDNVFEILGIEKKKIRVGLQTFFLNKKLFVTSDFEERILKKIDVFLVIFFKSGSINCSFKTRLLHYSVYQSFYCEQDKNFRKKKKYSVLFPAKSHQFEITSHTSSREQQDSTLFKLYNFHENMLPKKTHPHTSAVINLKFKESLREKKATSCPRE